MRADLQEPISQTVSAKFHASPEFSNSQTPSADVPIEDRTHLFEIPL